jgi:hypothetical protein
MNRFQFRLRILLLALCVGIFGAAVYKKLTEVSVKLPQTVSDSPIIVKPTDVPRGGGAG